jgi:hypothetical protein
VTVLHRGPADTGRAGSAHPASGWARQDPA